MGGRAAGCRAAPRVLRQPPSGAQSLTFLFETDTDARQQLFEDGKADFLLGLTEQAVERRSDSWSAEPGFRVAALLVNQLAEATGEEPLRQALSLSIDRNALTDALGARTHLSAQGLVPTGVRNTAGEEFRTVTGPVIDNLPEHREPRTCGRRRSSSRASRSAAQLSCFMSRRTRTRPSCTSCSRHGRMGSA